MTITPQDYKIWILKSWVKHGINYCFKNNIGFAVNYVDNDDQCEFIVKSCYPYQLMFIGVEIGKGIERDITIHG